MENLVHYITRVFDLMLSPFQAMHPFWPLCVFSLLTGVFMLLIFRYTSNQDGIRQAKNRIKAHLLEIRLFRDNLRVLLSAQRNLLICNAKYVSHAIKPMLFMVLPVSIILIQLHGWFGYRPLNRGEATVFTVKFYDGEREGFSEVSIETDEGLIVETPPLRIDENKEINWRIRVNNPGEHYITFNVSDETFQKKVTASSGHLARVSPRLVSTNIWDIILNPGERSITENSIVKEIEVDYPSRSIRIFGLNTHWLVVFFVMSIISGFAFKGFFQVEL